MLMFTKEFTACYSKQTIANTPNSCNQKTLAAPFANVQDHLCLTEKEESDYKSNDLEISLIIINYYKWKFLKYKKLH